MQSVFVKPEGQTLVPNTAYDAEIIDGLAHGVFRAQLTRPRSSPQNSLYWVTLQGVIEQTALGERYPTSRHLHKALLLRTGFTQEVATLDGDVALTPDSTAFDKMSHAQFTEYFNRAMAVLAEAVGCDPLQIKEMIDG